MKRVAIAVALALSLIAGTSTASLAAKPDLKETCEDAASRKPNSTYECPYA